MTVFSDSCSINHYTIIWQAICKMISWITSQELKEVGAPLFSDESTGLQKGKWLPSCLEVKTIYGFIARGRKELVKHRTY